MANKNLIIFVPAYNEEKSIFNLIKEIPSFPNINQKVIVINDGSTDNTSAIAKKAGAIVISNKKNLGLGYSFKIGLVEALKEDADIVVVLDGDGQYNPKHINKLITPILRNEADLVQGNRFLTGKRYESSSIKIFGNKFISIFLSVIILRRAEVFDVQSSFRAFNRSLATVLVKEIVGKYNYAQEMFIITSLHGYKIKQIPVQCSKRRYGKSRLIRNPFIHLIKILWVSFRTYLLFRVKGIY
jgi:glycosyltransferase involved in cell wall biosynthesis